MAYAKRDSRAVQLFDRENMNTALRAEQNALVSFVQGAARARGAAPESASAIMHNLAATAWLAIQDSAKPEKILECSPGSLAVAVMRACASGLTLGGTHPQAYLIPRGRIVTLMVSYHGLRDLALASGALRWTDQGRIYENDDYKIQGGLNPIFEHSPTLLGRGELIATYALAETTSGRQLFEVMPREDFEKVIEAATVPNFGLGPSWELWGDQMLVKAVQKRLYKNVPMDPEKCKHLLHWISTDNADFYGGKEPPDLIDTAPAPAPAALPEAKEPLPATKNEGGDDQGKADNPGGAPVSTLPEEYYNSCMATLRDGEASPQDFEDWLAEPNAFGSLFSEIEDTVSNRTAIEAKIAQMTSGLVVNAGGGGGLSDEEFRKLATGDAAPGK